MLWIILAFALGLLLGGMAMTAMIAEGFVEVEKRKSVGK
jgi:hypothetical protein